MIIIAPHVITTTMPHTCAGSAGKTARVVNKVSRAQ